MLGRTIEARSPLTASLLVCLLAAGVLVLWAVLAQSPHPAIAAALPGCLALALWFGRPPAVVVTLEANGIKPLGASDVIAYESITAIGHLDDERRRPIEIHHGDAVLILPRSMNVSQTELVRFLREQMPSAPEREPPAALADFAIEQRAKFGEEKVEIIRPRPLLEEVWSRRRNRAIVIAILATGLAWIAAGVSIGSFARRGDDYATWIALGAILIVGSWFVGLAMGRVGRSGNYRVLTKHQDSCIVISPFGFAMSQGDMQGILRWEQVLKVSTRIPQLLRTRGVYGLRLTIQGGEIIVLDVYDRTPYELERLVRSRLDRSPE